MTTETTKNPTILTVGDGHTYRTHIEVLELFGKHFTSHQRAISPLKEVSDDVYPLDAKWQVWFPKFYDNDKWYNKLEGEFIIQKSLDKPIDTTKEIPVSIVFAHEECKETSTLQYVFKGVFRRIDNHLEDEIRYKLDKDTINLDDFQQSQ